LGALYDDGTGLVVQSGPKLKAAPVDQPMPASLVLPNMLFKEVRSPKIGVHYASRMESRVSSGGRLTNGSSVSISRTTSF